MPESKTVGDYVTTKILITILLAIVFAATGLIVADTRTNVANTATKVEVLQDKKLDKEQYYRDISEIKQALKDIVVKIDKFRR